MSIYGSVTFWKVAGTGIVLMALAMPAVAQLRGPDLNIQDRIELYTARPEFSVPVPLPNKSDRHDRRNIKRKAKQRR